jgi:hypothetical protein
VLLLVERHTVSYAFLLLKLAYHRWTWGALLSPSADFCLGIIATSVVLPLQGLVLIYVIAIQSKVRRRWLYSALITIGIFVMPLIAEPLLWGSFPFIFDDQGVARLRIIPFIPWPSGRYGEY